MNISLLTVAGYVEKYLNFHLKKEISIQVKDNFYILNSNLKFPAYKFWEKTEKDLMRDFNGVCLAGDYIGTIFFFLSGYWENTHTGARDYYGKLKGKAKSEKAYCRFPYSSSFQYLAGNIKKPYVDILVDEIRLNLDSEYTFDKPYLFLTHYIDHLFLLRGINFWRRLAGDVLKRKSFSVFFNTLLSRLKKTGPYVVKNLIELHKKHATKGTYFFLPGKQPSINTGGYNWNRYRAYLFDLYDNIKKSDGGVGIHYDVRYFVDNRLSNDVRKIENIFNSKINSGRAHILIFDIIRSYGVLESSNILLDSSGGFAEHIGFRFGTSKPFKPYNFVTGKEYNIWEVRLIVMDGTLASASYMNCTPDKALQTVAPIIDCIKKYRGIFTFLWHNTSFGRTEWKNWEVVYEDIIKYCLNKGFHSVNSSDILNMLGVSR